MSDIIDELMSDVTCKVITQPAGEKRREALINVLSEARKIPDDEFEDIVRDAIRKSMARQERKAAREERDRKEREARDAARKATEDESE